MIGPILALALAVQAGDIMQQIIRGIDLDNCTPHIVSTNEQDSVHLTIICHKQGEPA